LSRKDSPTAITHLEAARVLFVELKSLAWQEKTEALLTEAHEQLAESPPTDTTPPSTKDSAKGSDHKAA
jgi:hypothetical protein